MIKLSFLKGNLRFPFFILLLLIVAYFCFSSNSNTSSINLLYNTSFQLSETEKQVPSTQVSKRNFDGLQTHFNSYPLYKFVTQKEYSILILMQYQKRKDSFNNVVFNNFGKDINRSTIGTYYKSVKNKDFIAIAISTDSLKNIEDFISKKELYERFKEH